MSLNSHRSLTCDKNCLQVTSGCYQHHHSPSQLVNGGNPQERFPELTQPPAPQGCTEPGTSQVQACLPVNTSFTHAEPMQSSLTHAELHALPLPPDLSLNHLSDQELPPSHRPSKQFHICIDPFPSGHSAYNVYWGLGSDCCLLRGA